MEGDKESDDNKKEKQHDKPKTDDEVKITIFGTKKDSKSKNKKQESKDDQSGHDLNEVNYNFRNKYKPYHDREYGVYYHRDCAAYNYRGYEIKEPHCKNYPKAEPKDEPKRWVQYMTHVEKQSKKPPRMYYYPNDNTFVQIVLMSLLCILLITLTSCVVAKYARGVAKFFLSPYDASWVPGIFGITFTIYSVLCSNCTRIFPIGFILLIVNVISTCILCMFVTAQHDTYGLIIALIAICLVMVFLIVLSFLDLDFRRFKMFLLAGLLAFMFSFGMIIMLETHNSEWLPDLPRRENLLVLGTVLYSWSVILMLQLIITDETVKLADDDFSIGTFMVYMCIPCLFMKLIAYLGLYEENR